MFAIFSSQNGHVFQVSMDCIASDISYFTESYELSETLVNDKNILTEYEAKGWTEESILAISRIMRDNDMLCGVYEMLWSQLPTQYGGVSDIQETEVNFDDLFLA